MVLHLYIVICGQPQAVVYCSDCWTLWTRRTKRRWQLSVPWCGAERTTRMFVKTTFSSVKSLLILLNKQTNQKYIIKMHKHYMAGDASVNRFVALSNIWGAWYIPSPSTPHCLTHSYTLNTTPWVHFYISHVHWAQYFIHPSIRKLDVPYQNPAAGEWPTHLNALLQTHTHTVPAPHWWIFNEIKPHQDP